MRRFIQFCASLYIDHGRLGLLMLVAVSLVACGGDKSKKPISSASSVSFSSVSSVADGSIRSSLSQSRSSLSDNDPNVIKLSGTITYDYVPYNNNNIGLNYLAVQKKPVRGVVVEVLTQDESTLSEGITGNDGAYSLLALKNTIVKVRVKSQLLQTTSPTWNFKVTDNTNNNALYVLDGAYVNTGITDSIRNLNAVSGWDGTRYAAIRSAAPFAILDNIYVGLERIKAAGHSRDFTPLEFRWSTKNNTADGEITRGEIGTSFFSGSEIYVLGDADNDTDEYDGHVVLHEWGHYLENTIFRSDSFGGQHADGDKLDMRLAMSEGFASAFAAMILNNSNYVDTSGSAQASGFVTDIANRNRGAKGYYSEGSVGSIFYNFYTSNNNKTANDFTSIFSVLSNNNYTKNEAMMSIFLFYDQYKKIFNTQYLELENLMTEQNIFGRDEYGLNETNNGSLAISLPVYKSISPEGFSVNVCSSPEFGKFNKLSNSQLLKLNISQSGSYRITANKSGGADVKSRPELAVFSRGSPSGYSANTLEDTVSLIVNLSVGTHIVEVYDNGNRDENNTDPNTLCFNLEVKAN
jgi:hypothetical protein